MVTSATAETKSRTLVVLKNGKLYLRHNSFAEDVPLVIVLRALGMESDQEMFQMVRHIGKYTRMEQEKRIWHMMISFHISVFVLMESF